MATVDEKQLCVQWFEATKSVTRVRRNFKTKLKKEPPSEKTIRNWYIKFKETGNFERKKSTGRPGTSNADVERIRILFNLNPKLSIRRASSELQMCPSTVQSILRRRLGIPAPKPEEGAVKEVKGDLFSCPATSALAHCISKDCRLGKGIAAIFKKKFGGIDELKKQGKNPGQTAVLNRDGRYVYYMVTKEKYFHKPGYASLKLCLEDVRKHCVENQVTELCMPRIGCGLDGLQWPKVRKIIQEVFHDELPKVTIYSQ